MMGDYHDEFNQYIKGSNELYLWKTSIENDFENGTKVNKTKYLKICNLYEERRGKARKLLSLGTCMPPHFPRPPLPPRQPSRRND